ncbi:MAG: hypothetical protein R2734_01790 [Nocardioides sp.]
MVTTPLRQQVSGRGAGVAVERLALGGRLQQTLLVGLAVDRDEWLGDVGEGGDRDRRTAHERA